MTLSPQFLDEVRARTHLSGLIGRSVKLTKAGREYKGCCPFHQEKTPSFYVNDEKGFYHCFGCSAHGDAIRFLTDARGLPFIDAVKELAAAAGLDMPAPDPRAAEKAERATGLQAANEAAASWFADQLGGIEGAEARAYLERRGIPAALARAFGIGFAPDARGKLKTALSRFGDETLVEAGLLISVEQKQPYDRFRGRLMIPIRDQRGRAIAFGGRILGAGEPKYLNSPDTPLFDKGRTLFNVDRAAPAARKANRLIVVEGYMDVIALARAGIDEAVAPNGTAITEAQLERMWRLAEVPVLCLDGDAAGQKAAVRAALRALPLIGPNRTLRFATLPPGLDPDDLIRNNGRSHFEELLSQATPLHELIWQSEVAAEPLSTPEARASLGKRLRDRARLIEDQDVRTHYLGFFAGQLGDAFSSQRRFKMSPEGRRFIESRRVPPELKAIFEHGIDQSVFVRAVLQGLRRHPSVLADLAEATSYLWIKDRDWARVRTAMVDAAVGDLPLDVERLETILRKEGLHGPLQRMAKARDLAFSFLRSDAEQASSEKQLAAVVEALAVAPNLEGAIQAAIRRFEQPELADWEEANRELERLLELKRNTEQTFSDLWHQSTEMDS